MKKPIAGSKEKKNGQQFPNSHTGIHLVVSFFFTLGCSLLGCPPSFDLKKLPYVLLFRVIGHVAYTSLLSVEIRQMQMSIDSNDLCDQLELR